MHRDIKPDNFLIGPKRSKSTVYLIDYGLVKAYINSKTGEHIKFRKDKGLTGTIRYSSVHTHMGQESSRRDDLEAILYVAIYLKNGVLPWQYFPKTPFKDK